LSVGENLRSCRQW